MNFSENIQTKANQYFSNLQAKYLNWSSQNIKVYKFDRINTENDFMNESDKKIFLPYFNIRAMYNDPGYLQNLDKFGLNETEDNILFGLNFKQMVATIESIKRLHTSEIKIKNLTSNNIILEKNNNIFLYTVNGIQDQINLFDEDYNTVNKVNIFLQSLSLTTRCLNGIISSDKLIDFDPIRLLPNTETILYSRYKKFDGTVSVIDIGDMIVTVENKLCEVTSAFMDGEIFTQEIGYTVLTEKINLMNVVLPNNGINDVFNSEAPYDNLYAPRQYK